MEPIHYIVTRWSLYDPSYFHGFKIVIDSKKEDIKQKLFDPERLKAKFEFFEKMTYPSVKNQTYKNYEWYIYTSTLLPQEYKDKLEKLQTSNIKIIYTESFAGVRTHFENVISLKKEYTSISIDDDDGIAPTFLEKLNNHSHQIGKLITFSRGFRYTIKDGNVIIGSKYHFPKINLGLAAIGHSIFKSGNHMTITERYDVIVDETPDMWWCACSDFCDTKRAFRPA